MRIALFGEPGSGKTTLAQIVSKYLGCEIVEASQEIIYPLASFNNFTDERGALNFLSANPEAAAISRKNARVLFKKIQTNFSPSFIARALHSKYAHPNSPHTYIFSGLRGIENAQYCKLHNDFIIYLHCKKDELVERLVSRGYSKEQAIEELEMENRIFKTRNIKSLANITLDTSQGEPELFAQKILEILDDHYRECINCVNSKKNPSIVINDQGLCQVCDVFQKNFVPSKLKKELLFLKKLKNNPHSSYDVMVGLSGGKDSTATLFTLKEMGFKPLAFTFDTGYLPSTTIPRAKKIAADLNIDHETIPLKPYVRKIDRECYEKTAQLYEKQFTLETKKIFLETYKIGREHYSIKCTHKLPFVRTCQICRRLVIRGYYAEAKKRKIPGIVLGINEWTRLSKSEGGKKYEISGMRTLNPQKNGNVVHIFHLPFILRRTLSETQDILKKINWEKPEGEDLVESNSNSCLFARSTERMARRLLGFHPDSTRLAREVTVGFINKEQAKEALGKLHQYERTPREVLENAGVL